MSEPEKIPPEILPLFKAAIKRWHEEIFKLGEQIDPSNSIDWYDMAIGFFMGCGIPIEHLEYSFLCDMTNDEIGKYLNLI